MKAIFIQPHLGLGDAIVCNGLVRVLARCYDELHWPALSSNLASLRAMWADLENLLVVPVKDDAESSKHGKSFTRGLVLRLGVFSNEPLETCWDRQMYRQAGVPFEERWRSFKLPVGKWEKLCDPVAFLHDDPVRGFVIDRQQLPANACQPGRHDVIFEVLPWLQQAPEIHVIDSAFLCLADSVSTVGRLVFHRYARPHGCPPTLAKSWEVLEVRGAMQKAAKEAAQ